MIFVIEYGTDEEPKVAIQIHSKTDDIDLDLNAYKPVRAVFFCETMGEATEIVNNLKEEYASNRD